MLGHDLDGDQEKDSYSLDFAHDAFMDGLTAERHAAEVRRGGEIDADAIDEVGDEDFAKFGLAHGWWTGYRNGEAVHHVATYREAIRYAFPGWQPANYDDRSDDLGESPDF